MFVEITEVQKILVEKETELNKVKEKLAAAEKAAEEWDGCRTPWASDSHPHCPPLCYVRLRAKASRMENGIRSLISKPAQVSGLPDPYKVRVEKALVEMQDYLRTLLE